MYSSCQAHASHDFVMSHESLMRHGASHRIKSMPSTDLTPVKTYLPIASPLEECLHLMKAACVCVCVLCSRISQDSNPNHSDSLIPVLPVSWREAVAKLHKRKKAQKMQKWRVQNQRPSCKTFIQHSDTQVSGIVLIRSVQGHCATLSMWEWWQHLVKAKLRLSSAVGPLSTNAH